MASVPRNAGQGGPLRLLWLIDSLTLGGAESLLAAFARAAEPSRLRLQVCFLKSIGGNPFEEALRPLGIPCTPLRARNLRDLPALRRLVRLVRQEHIDLIHAHLTYAAIFGSVAAMITGRPCVATLHVAPPPGPPWSRPGLRDRLMCRLLDRRAAAAIAVSQTVRDAYVDAGRIDASKIVVVHNGVECEAFAPGPGRREALRRDLGLSPEAKVVVTVSVLREGKGLDVLVRAARHVAAEVPEAVFLIAGDGPLRDRLRVQTEEAGVSEQVRWLGFRPDVADLLAAGDLFVLPSRDDAFPTVILEAMAAGLPVVATRAGGIPEIVDAPRTGWLVPPGDAESLARAVADLLSRPEERAALGEAGQTRARARFSAAEWVGRLEAVYARALAGRRQGP